MRLPRVRFSVRGMMVAVAILGVASLGGRNVLAWWLRRPPPNPVHPSQLGAGLARGAVEDWAPDRPLPISISYDFRFGNPKPVPGTSSLLLGMVWVEDAETHRALDCFSFDALIAVGGREATSGNFVWLARVPRPGRYMISYALYHRERDGVMGEASGGSSSVRLPDVSERDAEGTGP